MNKFYSSLVISNKHFPHVHQVIRPRYNKEFFKRLTKNIDQLDQHVRLRSPRLEELSRQRLDLIKKEAPRYVHLKDKLEKINDVEKEGKHHDFLNELNLIQDRIMPSVIRIPNRFNGKVPKIDTILDQVETNFLENQNLTKVLSHIKLSYINKSYSKSVVGPNSYYYTGIGAKLQQALDNYFFTQLERNKFIAISGLCLAKSALVEACNSKEIKDYVKDPSRILSDEPTFTGYHLTEASREALVGFLSTLGHIVSNEPVKFMCSGSAYRKGSIWFDGDDEKVTQYQTIHAIVWNPSIEQYSTREYEKTKDLIWAIYKELNLPLRLVHCGLGNMHSNEYDAHKIEVWLPSQKSWLICARVSHYVDYITIRSGMKRGHLLDSMIYDGQSLGAAIVENRQTQNGRFIIPTVLKEHLPHITHEEKSNYLEVDHATTSKKVCKFHEMTNYEQRRFLVKKTPLFSHSKRAYKNSSKRKLIWSGLFFGGCHMIAMIDWEEVFFRMLPLRLQRLMFNYIYRPIRKIWWYLVYVNVEAPPDLSFDEIDWSIYEKTMYERRREAHDKVGRSMIP